MSSIPNEAYKTFMIADLYRQPRPFLTNPFTTVDHVRHEFGYGQWICLYVTATGRRLDGNLWAHGLRDRENLDFRMDHPVLTVWETLRRYLASSADEERVNLRREFRRLHPSGYLGKEEFFSTYGRGWYTDRRISDVVFDLFDVNGDGMIDGNEWVYAASVLIAGRQRLRLIFYFFDADGDGCISRNELLRIALPMYRLYREIGVIGSLPNDESTPEKLVDKIFRSLDKNNDNKLSFTEFQQGYGRYPDVFQYLSRFSRR